MEYCWSVFLISVMSSFSFCFLSLLCEIMSDIISPLITSLSVSHKVDGDTESKLLNSMNSSIAFDINLQKILSDSRAVLNFQALGCDKFWENKRSRETGA